MGVAFQVMLLGLAIVIAVAGIGVTLALRMSARQRKRGAPVTARARPRPAARPAAAPAPAAQQAMARARAGAAAEAEVEALVTRTAPTDPEAAHKAKLAALQALLALGDAKAEKEGGSLTFADTQPADDAYATTQFVEGRAGADVSLLNLDKVPDKAAKAKSPRA